MGMSYKSANQRDDARYGRAIDSEGMKINLKANSKSSGNHTSTRCFTKVNSCSNCQLFLVQVKKVAWRLKKKQIFSGIKLEW